MRDWCISRQLWWGHRIPAFYYTLEGEAPAPAGSPSERTDHWVVAADSQEAERKIRERHAGQGIASLEQVSAQDPPVMHGGLSRRTQGGATLWILWRSRG